MKASFIAAINQICSEKNVGPDQVLEAVKQAIATAYRKDYGNKEQEIRVDLLEGRDEPVIMIVKEVVDDVENENFEISIKEAKKIKSDADVGIALDPASILEADLEVVVLHLFDDLFYDENRRHFLVLL